MSCDQISTLGSGAVGGGGGLGGDLQTFILPPLHIKHITY